MNRRLILMFLLMALLSPVAVAQKTATVKSFTMTTDHIGSNDRRKDLNGVPCALLKVFVVDDIDRVEGNVIGDVLRRGSVEKWIYMCKGSRNVRIHMKNRLPIKVMFNDYKINGLESNRVYELVINVPDATPAPVIGDVKGNSLNMMVTPANANVRIWSAEWGEKIFRPLDDGSLNVNLPYGRYYYNATADGYQDASGNVFVNDEARTEFITLTPITGTLRVNCPKGMDYYIDGQLQRSNSKEKSWSVQLKPGSHTVTAEKKGFLTQSRTVEILPDQVATIEFGAALTEKAKKAEEKKAKQKEEERKKEEKAKEEKQKKMEQRREKERKEAEERNKKRQEKLVWVAKKDKQTVTFGVYAGYNMANAEFKDYSPESVSGFHVGMSVDFRLAKSFYLKTGLAYSMRGYTIDQYILEEEAKASYIDIPVLASVKIPLSKVVKLVIDAGPYLGLCIDGSVKDKSNRYDEKFSSVYSTLDYGVQGGIGVELFHNWYIGGCYQLGLESHYQNRTISGSIGYRF